MERLTTETQSAEGDAPPPLHAFATMQTREGKREPIASPRGLFKRSNFSTFSHAIPVVKEFSRIFALSRLRMGACNLLRFPGSSRLLTASGNTSVTRASGPCERIAGGSKITVPLNRAALVIHTTRRPDHFRHGRDGHATRERFFARLSTTLLALSTVLPLTQTGCIHNTDANAKLMTAVDPEQAHPDYWWNLPAAQHVTGRDFDKMWAACKGELYVRLFPLDREQYREGLITSEPVVSKQIFEPWRNDAVTAGDVAESSLATIRRTIHIEVRKLPDGTYEATPKVLIERWASTERRLTAINQYHQAFSGGRTSYDGGDQSGAQSAADYWYALRRDPNLEKVLADSIRHQLGEQ